MEDTSSEQSSIRRRYPSCRSFKVIIQMAKSGLSRARGPSKATQAPRFYKSLPPCRKLGRASVDVCGGLQDILPLGQGSKIEAGDTTAVQPLPTILVEWQFSPNRDDETSSRRGGRGTGEVARGYVFLWVYLTFHSDAR